MDFYEFFLTKVFSETIKKIEKNRIKVHRQIASTYFTFYYKQPKKLNVKN